MFNGFISKLSIGFLFAVASNAFGVSILPAPHQIVFIGDSHSEATFGNKLDELLRERISANANSYGVGGSTPLHWLTGRRGDWGYVERHPGLQVFRDEKRPTPLASQLIAQFKPDIFVIEQGGNCIWEKNDKICADATRDLAILVSQSVKTCVWIGPARIGSALKAPLGYDKNYYEEKIVTVHDLIKEQVLKTSCHWIDSFEITQYPEGVPNSDGIHFDTAGPKGVEAAVKWAQSAESRIEKFLQK